MLGRMKTILLPGFLSAVLLLLNGIGAGAAEDRRARVLNDRGEVMSAGSWIYNDLPRGWEEARRTGKPLLVVLRCVT